jgi:sec-independent protein translocase protein TatB
MFDFGWPEILVIAIVLIVVVGPKDLPRVLRSFGRTTAKLRGMAGEFRKQFDEALREAELDDVKGLVNDARKLDPRNEIKKHLSPLEEAGRDIRSGLDAAMKPTPAKSTPATEPVAAAPLKNGAVNLPGGTTAKQDGGKPPAAAAKAPAAKAAAKPAAKKTPKAKPATKAADPKPAAKAKPAAKTKKTIGTTP